MTKETSPALNKIRDFKIKILTDLYNSMGKEDQELFGSLFGFPVEDIEDMVFEAAVKMCEDVINKQNEALRETLSTKKELNHLGFLGYDYLSSCITEKGEGTLWVFNHGSYSKIRHHLCEFIDNDRKFSGIEDWMIDTFYDYKFPALPTVISITSATKEEYDGTILLDYPPEEIGQECIKINFKY